MNAQGKAHVVRTRTVIIEEHVDDCGEDLSSLKGSDTVAVAWTSSIPEDAHHYLEDEAHALLCDGLERIMFNITAVLPQKSPASVARYNALGEVPQGRPMQHTCIEIADFQEHHYTPLYLRSEDN